MIINSTYFKKGINYIPNGDVVNRTAVANPEATSTLEDVIAENERVLLINALNPILWNVIKSNYSNGVLSNDAPQWVKDLINGLTYTYEDKVYVWDGLKAPNSLLVKYVFCQYLNDDMYAYLVRGVSKLKTDASMLVSPSDLYVEQWNEFVDKYQQDFCFDNEIIPRTYFNTYGYFTDYTSPLYNQNKVFVSLLTFVDHYNELFPDTYTDINKQRYERQNKMGI